MNLFVIAGFLGSGKTTLLLAIAKAFSERGMKLAIIENEVGSVGVDDIFLKEEGLPVREIYSGCICCSLRIDLIRTLLEIEREYAPDVILLEPSGVASPKQVLSSLNGYGGEIRGKQLTVLIDAERFHRLQDLSIPIIADGILNANLLVINKIDTVGKTELDTVKTRIRNLRQDAEFQCVSALLGTGMHALVDRFVEVAGKDSVDPEKQHSENDGMCAGTGEGGRTSAPDPVVVAYEWQQNFPDPEPAAVCSDRFRSGIQLLGRSLTDAGCTMIGHIKVIVKSESGGYLLVRSTVSGQIPDVKGKLPPTVRVQRIALNIIVYGIERETVKRIAESIFPIQKGSLP